MPLFQCSKCGAEWEGRLEDVLCDSCEAGLGRVIQEKTDTEKFIESLEDQGKARKAVIS